jgi:hypothetical protein
LIVLQAAQVRFRSVTEDRFFFPASSAYSPDELRRLSLRHENTFIGAYANVTAQVLPSGTQ